MVGHIADYQTVLTGNYDVRDDHVHPRPGSFIIFFNEVKSALPSRRQKAEWSYPLRDNDYGHKTNQFKRNLNEGNQYDQGQGSCGQDTVKLCPC